MAFTGPSGGSDQRTRILVLHSRRLGEQLYDYALVRFAVVAAIVLGALFAQHVLQVTGLPVVRLIALAAVLGLVNIGTFLIARRFRGPDIAPAHARLLMGLMHFTITSDFLFLAAALWMVGGSRSPFQTFFLFHVLIASVLLSARATYAYAVLGYLLLAGLVIGEWQGWIPPVHVEGAVLGPGPVAGRYVFTLLVVQGLLFTLSAFILTQLVSMQRRDEARLFSTNAELARLSALRRDFLHIAMHNLRSPVAAVSMLLHNLEYGNQSLSPQQSEMLARSQRRLAALSGFLHDLQYLALLENGEIREHAEPLNIEEILADLVAEQRDAADARKHVLRLEIAGSLPVVWGVPRLVREAVVNYVTNAIKYTPDGGEITVRAFAPDTREVLRIEVEDSGIGIAPENRHKLFQEFVRIQEKETSEIPGTGLGLSIVRRVAEAHGGHVTVDSVPGRGSTFGLELPLRDAPMRATVRESPDPAQNPMAQPSLRGSEPPK